MRRLNQIRRVAVVGSGSAGLTAAHLLRRYNIQVTLFEKNHYAGGHAHTVNVKTDEGDYAIDTGFVVFNQETYPNFIRLLDQLNVEIQVSNMSFSFSSKDLGLEYSGNTLSGVFAQRQNLFKPQFYRLLLDIHRFNQQGSQFLDSPDFSDTILLKEFIRGINYGDWFKQAYLLPMSSAIWSVPPMEVGNIPAYFILKFYQNHGLLNLWHHLQWYTIKGGSRVYVQKIIQPFSDNLYLSTPVKKIVRDNDYVKIQTDQSEQIFDAVVIACHSDQALELLERPTRSEIEILGAIPYCKNEAILHTDSRVMPTNRRAWASWNYVQQCRDQDKTCLTYYMNKLQSIHSNTNFFVSINQNKIDPESIIDKFYYSHPVYNANSVLAKERHLFINGKNRTFFTGAYWGNGFHEDGILASLNALSLLGLHW